MRALQSGTDIVFSSSAVTLPFLQELVYCLRRDSQELGGFALITLGRFQCAQDQLFADAGEMLFKREAIMRLA